LPNTPDPVEKREGSFLWWTKRGHREQREEKGGIVRGRGGCLSKYSPAYGEGRKVLPGGGKGKFGTKGGERLNAERTSSFSCVEGWSMVRKGGGIFQRRIHKEGNSLRGGESFS